mmetsp:Transcript_114002/g.322757  ORF Transcript_114002/g.322757 Transcript_114002/m.322757 type:complete len:407 (+) Transcript_114002:16-1236(+)
MDQQVVGRRGDDEELSDVEAPLTFTPDVVRRPIPTKQIPPPCGGASFTIVSLAACIVMLCGVSVVQLQLLRECQSRSASGPCTNHATAALAAPVGAVSTMPAGAMAVSTTPTGATTVSTAAPTTAMSCADEEVYIETNPQIVHAQQNRYVPRTHHDFLVATYSWWELLDGNMEDLNPRGAWKYGYIREHQMLRYTKEVRRPHVKHYCEIGVNGGHGTVAMLLANPTIKVTSFDYPGAAYSQSAYHLIKMGFPRRFEIFVGSSYPKGGEPGHVVEYAKKVKKGLAPKCDVLLIDGDHSYNGTLTDIKNAEQLVACEHTVFMDDVYPIKNMPPGMAMAFAASEQNKGKPWAMTIDEEHQSPTRTKANPCLRLGDSIKCLANWTSEKCEACFKNWGFAIAHYTHPSDCR